MDTIKIHAINRAQAYLDKKKAERIHRQAEFSHKINVILALGMVLSFVFILYLIAF